MKNGPNNKTIEEKNELYEKYKNLIHTVLRDVHCDIKTKEQYDDYYSVAQYGLAKAINNISGDWKNSTSSYFYTYIRNELINYFHYRTRPKRFLLGTDMADIDEYPIDAGINVEEDYLKKERNEELYDAIKSLKPIYQDIITRRFGINRKQETIKELAEEYGVSHQAIQQREIYALEKLKKELQRRANEQKGKVIRIDWNYY